MDNTPDFSQFGYRIVNTLGKNHFGGRTTYLATKIDTKENIVIKQFQFAVSNSDWLGYKSYQREIDILEQLENSGIPKYLDSFETVDGFCMVQEYKQAPSLAISRSYEPEEIKDIAVNILEILIYLQNRIPTVIHRDLKPENILVDKAGKVYLVDFGFARVGSENLAMSSVTLGTLGFMPPEQLYNRRLTAATDLYSLGMTLICLLTKTKSSDIDALIDEDNNISFQHLLPQLSQRWLDWLQTLVQRNPKYRYQNATEALEQLKPIYIFKQPEAKLSTFNLEFTANTYGEKLTKTITVTNAVADTILEGNWQVAPHKSDPPHTPDKHTWISFSELNFVSNEVELKVTVDTSKLLADSNYQRDILLTTNSYPETKTINIGVQTARKITSRIPYIKLFFLIVLTAIYFFLASNVYLNYHTDFLRYSIIGFAIGSASALFSNNKKNINFVVILFGGFKGILLAIGLAGGRQYVFSHVRPYEFLYVILGVIIGATVQILALSTLNKTRVYLKKEKFSNFTIYSILSIAILWACTISYYNNIVVYDFIAKNFISYKFSFSRFIEGITVPFVLNKFFVRAALIQVFLLLSLIFYHNFKSFVTSKKYRKSEPKLIKP